MKKVLALIAVVALLAPAIAVCAGRTSGRVGPHDCCPPDEQVAPTSPTVADASCCDRADEAAQRTAVLAPAVSPAHFGAPLALQPSTTHEPTATAAFRAVTGHRGPPDDSPPVLAPPLPLRI